MVLIADLRAARALIAEPEHWCRHYRAGTADGTPVLPDDPAATRWCLTGAIDRVQPGDGNAAVKHALRKQAPILSVYWLPLWNDTHTHAEVLALFDAAIAAAEEASNA